MIGNCAKIIYVKPSEYLKHALKIPSIIIDMGLDPEFPLEEIAGTYYTDIFSLLNVFAGFSTLVRTLFCIFTSVFRP